MNLDFAALGPSGHVQATFEGEEIRIEFSKTTPGERGLIDILIERGKKEEMTVHTADKKGNRKPLEDQSVLGKIMEKKGEIVLKGKRESVIRIIKACIDKEIEAGRVVMESQEDNSWKVLKSGEFEEKEKPQKVKSVAPVGGG